VSENDYDELRLAELIAALPPAPAAWVTAAQEFPLAFRSLDGIVERARKDLEYRRAVIADLEGALAETGVEPDRRLVESLRRKVAEL
jgi:hypothetical protein